MCAQRSKIPQVIKIIQKSLYVTVRFAVLTTQYLPVVRMRIKEAARETARKRPWRALHNL